LDLSDSMTHIQDHELQVEYNTWELDIPTCPKVSIEPLPDNFLLETFSRYHGYRMLPISHTISELREELLARLRLFILTKNPGDFELQIARLTGPSDVISVVEFFSMIIYFSSNNMFLLKSRMNILNWILRQNKSILQKILTLSLPTVQAFFESMVHTAIETSNVTAGIELLNADTKRQLYAHHPEKLLLAAIKLNHIELVRILVSEIVDNGYNINNPPHIQVSTHYVKRSRFGGSGKTKLATITMLGATRNVEVVKILIEAGANVDLLHYDDADGELLSPVKRATRKGNIELVRLFIQSGADINEKALSRIFFSTQ